MRENYKDWEMPDIIKWCQENNQVDWLKATAATKVKKPIYPKVAHTSKTGKQTMVYDKKAKPIGHHEVKISFVEIKSAFIEKFFPEQKNQKEKKETFYDIIANL
jgi:hypothetical protein